MLLPVFVRPSRNVCRSCSRVINAIVSIPSNCRSFANRRLPAIARDDDDDNNYIQTPPLMRLLFINRTDRRVSRLDTSACLSDELRIVRRSRLAVITRRNNIMRHRSLARAKPRQIDRYRARLFHIAKYK